MYQDEGPSQEDIERFSTNETGFCPHCNEEIWDDASQCPECDYWLKDGTVHQNIEVRAFKKKFFILIIITLLICFFWGVTRFF
ncbi:MAG: hypothetical protein HOC27_08135 [Phycisphaerae bacterium]|jgi:hypothetical protein|nr:hypothetical protein [Phycisphaerae bacterium]